jgi:hypothetical protein
MEDLVELKQVASHIKRNTHVGASFWTTFRWLADIVYGLCWMLALPLELVTNIRVGRRYASLLPLVISAAVFVAFTVFAAPFLWRFVATAIRWMGTTDGGKAIYTAFEVPWTISHSIVFTPWFLPIAIVVIGLSLLRHRLGNWMRFRGGRQIHSRSPGISLSAYMFFSQEGTAGDGTRSITLSPEPIIAPPVTVAKIWRALPQITQEAISQLDRGLAPEILTYKGWLVDTVAVPLAWLIVGFVVTRWEPVLGMYLMVAGGAIFLKARIAKAHVVELVYDMVDGRIDQEFRQSLGKPAALDRSARSGVIVPSIARIVNGQPMPGSAASPLSPELATLIAGESAAARPGATPRSSEPSVEPKRSTSSDTML